jgi:hypothetical protein
MKKVFINQQRCTFGHALGTAAASYFGERDKTS